MTLNLDHFHLNSRSDCTNTMFKRNQFTALNFLVLQINLVGHFPLNDTDFLNNVYEVHQTDMLQLYTNFYLDQWKTEITRAEALASLCSSDLV